MTKSQKIQLKDALWELGTILQHCKNEFYGAANREIDPFLSNKAVISLEKAKAGLNIISEYRRANGL